MLKAVRGLARLAKSLKLLAGDPTDNVPGVPGIGVKTAADLINRFGDLETLLAHAGEITQPKRRETLTAEDFAYLVGRTKGVAKATLPSPSLMRRTS